MKSIYYWEGGFTMQPKECDFTTIKVLFNMVGIDLGLKK